MKLLVFAHTPPPHHGQSYMVKLMLDGFGGDQRKATKQPASTTLDAIHCYHVNTRFSDDLADLGKVRWKKFLLIFRYSLEAIWCRFRYGVDTFYFAPAPPKWPALYRDWLVMLICRPFFRRFIHHWHAVGTADWLRREGNWLSRWLTRRLLGKASLGLALASSNLRDALWLETSQVKIVPNGIPDLFPDFQESVLPIRKARLEARSRLLRGEPIAHWVKNRAGPDVEAFQILYVGSCFREKGIFEMLDGVAQADAALRTASHPLRLRLTVAGDFTNARDRAQFLRRIREPDLATIIRYAGFVDAEEKKRLLIESDCLCFPTYCDSFGVVVLEAMASGLSIIATNWGALPEILPANYIGFVPVKDAQAIATRIPLLFTEDGSALRGIFLQRFSARSHLRALHEALHLVENPEKSFSSKRLAD